jgi:hypothetical protein
MVVARREMREVAVMLEAGRVGWKGVEVMGALGEGRGVAHL